MKKWGEVSQQMLQLLADVGPMTRSELCADAAARAARALDAEVWETFNPCGLLEQLICVGEVK